MGLSEDADDDEEEEPAFMPFTGEGGHQDPSATLRGDPRGVAKKPAKKAVLSQTSDSSNSSTAPVSKRVEATKRQGPRPGPLSPRRAAELSGRSPGKREGSEGSPSMGSSFSDLDGESCIPE